MRSSQSNPAKKSIVNVVPRMLMGARISYFGTIVVRYADVGRMYQSLGCPRGCRDGIKGVQGDDVRAQSRSFLQRLSNLDKVQFSRYIQRSFLAQTLQSVMDQLHALIGFCAEPIVLQSGLYLSAP